jgi:hypothetical protein
VSDLSPSKEDDLRSYLPIVAAIYAALVLLAPTSSAQPMSPSTLVSDFLCIHSHEGSWTDPGAPYYGGLQMDWQFMSTYGGEYLRAWGTADHWPPSVQIAVAMRAYLSGRGFYPWPNTARQCGLI